MTVAGDGVGSAGNRSGGSVAAVERALEILSALERAESPPTLTEISKVTGFYKSTILRLLESLLHAGYVMRVDNSKYALGPAVARLAESYQRLNPLRLQVVPVLERLVENGSESPSFHIRQTSEERLCLFRVDSHHSTLDRVRTGDVLPLRRGAAGKLLLAFHGEPGPIFDQIRHDHLAFSLGERDPSCAGVAVPVFGARNRFIGALSLSGPRERFQAEDIRRMSPMLRAAAKDLSRILGASED